jgi:hypothetical protein
MLKSKYFLFSLGIFFLYCFIACDNGTTNQTPVVSDFTFGNFSQTVDSVIPVTITLQEEELLFHNFTGAANEQ